MSTETQNKKNYKDTLNLPRTDFAMEAKLVTNEPPRLAKWREADLYGQILQSREGAETWVLHDGPPFANGDIHLGHLINKTLKDVIIRFRTLEGFRAPYVPGWDCHGLPIEHKIQEQLGSKWREMDVAALRKLCFEYANKYAGVQSEQFQRLGILGDWKDPYLTMSPGYEASTLEVFAKFVEAGLVYKKLKPVPWSVSNQTALADAELEYKDVEDTSIYVEFPVSQSASFPSPGTPGEGQGEGIFEPGTTDEATRDTGKMPSPQPSPGVPGGGVRGNLRQYFLVWTTTPWTLPANLAMAVHPEVQYAYVRYRHGNEERIGIVAEPLVEAVFGNRADVQFIEKIQTIEGGALTNLHYDHPFREDRKGLPILSAEYVTTTDGTGLVHTAPGHGEEDYETGVRNKLEVYSPVLANGRFDLSVPEWLQGKTIWEGNPLIIEHLKEKGLLLASQPIRHSYPHDWRSKKPIIFRATEQWFVAMDKGPKPLRKSAENVIGENIEFVPEWGRARMLGMIESRPDWCISRQRAWGLPIPIFYNEPGEALLTAESVRAVAKRFAEKGSNAWFTDSPAQLLGTYEPGPNFPKDKLRKEKDIFDVWFESGSSWHGVLEQRPDLKFPADLYLEGSDQHRGWFQLSLLASLGATGKPPFRQVLTHGFVVKPDGTKVSKSDEEYVTAIKEIETHGADVLRLWCCSMDYQHDIPASPQAIREFGDKYRKIRNTLRYLLSNLYDYAPEGASDVNPELRETRVPPNSLDAWVLDQLDTLISEVKAGYDSYQFHKVFRLLHDFCAVQISAIYGNAMKDRLYCESADSPLRRRCQSVMHRMVLALTKMLSPILVFTADEAWEQISHKPAGDADLASVHLALLPETSGQIVSDDQREEWKLLLSLREQALLELDQLKKQAGMNKALDAEIVYYIDDPQMRLRLQSYGPDLEDLVGAGHHSIEEKNPEGKSVAIKMIDRRQSYSACARSWKRRPDVGQDSAYPDLCLRDAQALRAHVGGGI